VSQILHNDDAHRIAIRNANSGNIDLKTQRRQVVIEVGNQLIIEFTQHIKTQWFDKSNQFVPPLLSSRCPSQERQQKNNAKGAINAMNAISISTSSFPKKYRIWICGRTPHSQTKCL
jgi:hypothetical protein